MRARGERVGPVTLATCTIPPPARAATMVALSALPAAVCATAAGTPAPQARAIAATIRATGAAYLCVNFNGMTLCDDFTRPDP